MYNVLYSMYLLNLTINKYINKKYNIHIIYSIYTQFPLFGSISSRFNSYYEALLEILWFGVLFRATLA